MALTEPDFIERDADKITAEMIAKYEADTGKTLYPAQAERSVGLSRNAGQGCGTGGSKAESGRLCP